MECLDRNYGGWIYDINKYLSGEFDPVLGRV